MATITTEDSRCTVTSGCDQPHIWARLSGAVEGLACARHIDLAREDGVEIELLDAPTAPSKDSACGSDHIWMPGFGRMRHVCFLCGRLYV